MKNFKWPKHSVLIIAIVATWITTYIGYKTSFNMKIDNMMAGIHPFDESA